MPPPRSSRYTPPKGTEAEEKLGLVIGQAEDLDPQAKADAEVIKWMGSYGAQWQPQPFQYQVFAGTIEGNKAIFLKLETAVGRLCFAMSDENAQGLIDHLTTVISGLQVVRNPMQL
jgi:hypothetical protein